MNFDFTEKEQAFFESLQHRMTPFDSSDDTGHLFTETGDRSMADGLSRLAEIGYLPLGLEEETSSFGSSLTLMRAREILAGVSPSLYLSVEMGAHLFGKIIDRWGSQTQKECILPDLKRGKILGAVAVSEESMNVNNDPMKTKGQFDAEGAVVINGSKSYVVNATCAEYIAVIGRLDKKEALFLVKRGTPGMTIGDRIRPMGFEGADMAGIKLSSCTIAAADVIAEFGKDNLLEVLKRWENQILVGASLGLMKSSLQIAKDHAESHESGGKPVKAYQAVGFKLAEMLAIRQTSQLLAYRAAWSEDNDSRACAGLTLCAKVFCTESAERIASQALQVMSGKGYFSANRAERAFRCSKYGQIAGTSSEIARVKLGDEALGYRV